MATASRISWRSHPAGRSGPRRDRTSGPGRRSGRPSSPAELGRRRSSVMRRPPGLREVDRPGQERLAEDDARDAGDRAGGGPRRGRRRRRRRGGRRRSGGDAGRASSASGVAGRRGRGRSGGRRGPASSRDDRVEDVGGAAPVPGERREPLRPRVEPDGEPVAGDLERSRRGPSGRRRSPSRSRPGSPRRRTRAGSRRRCRRRRRAGAGRRSATRSPRPPRGSPGGRCRAPSKSTRWISRAPLATNCSAIRSGSIGRGADAGRDAGPEDDPGAPSIEVDRRDDLHPAQVRAAFAPSAVAGPVAAASAPAGSRPRRALAQQAAVEADRQRAVARAACRGSRAGENAAPRRRLLVGAELEQEDLAEQVRQLVGRRVRVAADLGPGVRGLEARLGDQEAGRVVDRDLAAVHPDVEDDPAGPPDRVGVHREPEVRGRRRSPARASSARSTCPSPRRTRARRSASRVSDGWPFATASWRWWPGYASWMLVLLIEL